jgi:tetratricopeptide (TPR) repeat protein
VNWEGSTLTWDMFSQAHIGEGIRLFEQKKYREAFGHFETSLTWPENLGVGHSDRTEEAMGWFWKGKALLALGKNKEAAEAWKKGSETPDGSEKQNEFKELCRKLLL